MGSNVVGHLRLPGLARLPHSDRPFPGSSSTWVRVSSNSSGFSSKNAVLYKLLPGQLPGFLLGQLLFLGHGCGLLGQSRRGRRQPQGDAYARKQSLADRSFLPLRCSSSHHTTALTGRGRHDCKFFHKRHASPPAAGSWESRSSLGSVLFHKKFRQTLDMGPKWRILFLKVKESQPVCLGFFPSISLKIIAFGLGPRRRNL